MTTSETSKSAQTSEVDPTKAEHVAFGKSIPTWKPFPDTIPALATAIKRLRKNIEKVSEADPVTEDLLIGITARLEQLHWMWQAQTV